MKDVELRLIAELIRNSRRSDRDLAKAIGVSQPTVSRVRVRLEKQGLIDYSAVPNLDKLGFEIIAVTLCKRNYVKHPEYDVQKAKDFARRYPNVIFGSGGSGLGYDRVGISIHRNYGEYSSLCKKAEFTGVTSWILTRSS